MRKNGQLREIAATKGNHARGSLSVLAMAGIAAVFLSTGCSADPVCDTGQYPIKAVGGTVGQACQADGTQPSAGFVRYPKGKVPQHVGDKWDTYWSTVVVNKHGQIVKH
jgi:hypothetical protein